MAGRITADSVLSLLGTPIQVDPFQDPEDARTAIDACLKATGVCVEVGFPWIVSSETSLGGSTHVEAMCEIFVAENIKGAHTPNRASLVQRVIQACTRPLGVQKAARLRSAESVKTEKGYILHMFGFFIPLNIKQQ
jgi:hypothetical protein